MVAALSPRPKSNSAPWMWRGYRPSPGQALLSMVVAVVGVAFLWYIAPPIQGCLIRQLYVALHEASHASLALLTGGNSYRLAIEADGGPVISNGGNRLLISAAGPLLPGWLSATMLALGVSRQFNAAGLALVAVILSIVVWLGVAEPEARLGLSAWSILATLGALWPLGGLSRSVLVLVFALAIALGVLGSFPGLWSSGHPDQPSDISQVATELGLTGVHYTATTFAALIIAGYALAVLYIANWLYRHCR